MTTTNALSKPKAARHQCCSSIAGFSSSLPKIKTKKAQVSNLRLGRK
jgi:hypothetical protein